MRMWVIVFFSRALGRTSWILLWEGEPEYAGDTPRIFSPPISILAECRELRLLDVSFCDQIQESQVLEWRRQYPQVSIKRSFQSANLTTAPNALFLAPSLE